MAQARRIKPKPVKKARKNRLLPHLPWGLMTVILICATALALLINGAQHGDTRFGAGLKTILDRSDPVVEEDREIAQLIETRGTQTEFEFYELLKDIEKVMPDDLPYSTPDRPDPNVDYYLQAASFRDFADAEKLRASLALKGYKSVTQMREVEGKGTYYRIRLGPYADKRKAKTAKTKLQKLGVRPFVYTVEK